MRHLFRFVATLQCDPPLKPAPFGYLISVDTPRAVPVSVIATNHATAAAIAVELMGTSIHGHRWFVELTAIEPAPTNSEENK